MLRRRKTDAAEPSAPRSVLSTGGGAMRRAAWAVEECLVWRGADNLRGIVDAVRWPFERIAWALERSLIWPLRERSGRWEDHRRLAGGATLGVLAIGAGVLALALIAGDGSKSAPVEAATPVPQPVVQQAPPVEKPVEAAPVLQGAKPDFSATGGVAAAKADGKKASDETTTASAAPKEESAAAASSAPAATEVVPVGPAAAKVAHRFASAFVRFETGQSNATVRSTFAATATPQLARSLLHRPPRLPANVDVPQAKVLNLVPGPRHGDTYTMSVSLLRVGVTSELRIDMQRDKRSGEWQVTDVLG